MADDTILPESNETELGAANNQEDTTMEAAQVVGDTQTDIAEVRAFLQDADIDSIVAVYKKRSDILGTEEFERLQEIPGTYENLLYVAGSSVSTEAMRTLKSLGKIGDKAQLKQTMTDANGKNIIGTFLKPKRASGNGKLLTGKEARLEFAIKSGRAKRVALYNSGFHIDLESPRLTALNDFFTKAYVETAQYGREFGASFFFFNDLLIKEAIVEVMLQHTMGASMKHWNRDGNILRYIKLPDMKVILTALSSLMFQDGFNFTHVCKNPSGSCNHTESALIDISKFVMQDFTKLTSDAIDHMKLFDGVSTEAVEKYQESLNFKREIRIGNVSLTLRVPSIADHLAYGKKFNAELTKSNFADDTIDVYRSLAYAYYKVYTPFVESISLYDSAGVLDISTREQDVIADELGRLQDVDTDRIFIKSIDEYIDDSEITKICYVATPCPKCGYSAPDSNGYYSVDPEHTFFTLSLKKLAPT